MRYLPTATRILVLSLFSFLLFYAQGLSESGIKGPVEAQPKERDQKYVLVITIDGLRPDAIARSNSPNLKLLIREGSYSLEAKTVIPALTLPAHTSLVTGLTPRRHGTKFNHWIPPMEYLDDETILSIAKKSGSKTAMFVGKDKLKYLARPGTVDHFESTGRAPGSIETIASTFLAYLNSVKPELTLIHFPEPDLTGHRVGWMSEDYIRMIENVDRALGVILRSIDETRISDKTFIIITSDHGGEGTNHRSFDREVTTIPWIAYGPRVKKGYRIEQSVSICDTAPTVLFTMGIEPPPEWDGKPIKEIFAEQKQRILEE